MLLDVVGRDSLPVAAVNFARLRGDLRHRALSRMAQVGAVVDRAQSKRPRDGPDHSGWFARAAGSRRWRAARSARAARPMRNDADRPGAAGRAPLSSATAAVLGFAAGALGGRAVDGRRARSRMRAARTALPRRGRRLSGAAAGRLGRPFGASGGRVLPRLDAIR